VSTATAGVSRRVLVLGAAGFIGRAVCERALSQGWSVTGVVRPGRAVPPGVHLHAADVLSDDLVKLMDALQPHLILHCAGPASVADSTTAPLANFRGTVMTWHNVLESARLAQTRGVVMHLGSAAVYGQPDTLPVSETAPCRPVSPYGFHKVQCEVLADEYAVCHGIRTVSMRLFSVVGPAQRRLLVWELARQLLAGASCLTVRGTGAEGRDFLHVDDAAHAMLALAARLADEDPFPLRVNLASGVETRVHDIAESLVRLSGQDVPIRLEGRISKADPQRWCADVTLLRQLLPTWSPRGMDDALRSCLAAWSTP
jgi:UDP-glucose 4-epimerase